MEIGIATVDRKIFTKDMLLKTLYKCLTNNDTLLIDFSPEGSSAEALGLYSLLDNFCDATNYPKSNITIKTANMIERHAEYNIIRDPYCWYEIRAIQKWLTGKTISTGKFPGKHFANFSSRTNWSRLWIATILDQYYNDKTIQTYHYDLARENYNHNKYTGLDDLIRHNCDLYVEAAKFIQSCPRTLDLEYLQDLKNQDNTLFHHIDSYYPIQHPSNLNLLQYYHDIFVDIVVEPNVSGNSFLVTEKLWRSIIARRPFIVMSNHNYLVNLKRLGFRTFDNYWDESYDNCKEGDRILKIQGILEQIAMWTLPELNTKLIDMQDILEHNVTVFANLSPSKVSEAFNE